MIDDLRLEGFKGVKTGTIVLSPITILLGSNNSAKSTILEALFLGTNPFRNVPYYFPNPRRPGAQSRAIETLYYMHKTLDYAGFAFLLHNYAAKQVELSFGKKTPDRVDSSTEGFRIIKQGQEIFFISSFPERNVMAYPERRLQFRRPGAGVAEGVLHFFGRAFLNSLDFESRFDEPFNEETLLVSPKLISSGYEYLRREWASIVNSGVARRVAEDISRFSPELYKDFTMEPIIGGQLDINAYLEDGRRIRLGDLGEGIQSYLLSRILYEIINPQILLWDDIEAHLNPRILTTLAEWFGDLVKNGKQVIIATHSLEATSVVAGINEEKTSICLCSLKNGHLKTSRKSLSQIEELRKAGIDVRTSEDLML